MSNSQLMEATAARLEASIEPWRDRLKALDADSAHDKPSPERWSISEVVGHLVDSACNNHQRFVRAQEGSELEFPKYDQNHWAAAGAYRQSDWPTLVDLCYFYNRQLAVILRNIPASKLATPCTITPYEPCTLEFLATDYVDHLNHHLGKIAERIDDGAASTS